ncbi:MAG: hypothetical protein MZU97_00925 [Bacillus subtilis]|nr:hypothetical protein [Bacillus subtilis]
MQKALSGQRLFRRLSAVARFRSRVRKPLQLRRDRKTLARQKSTAWSPCWEASHGKLYDKLVFELVGSRTRQGVELAQMRIFPNIRSTI